MSFEQHKDRAIADQPAMTHPDFAHAAPMVKLLQQLGDGYYFDRSLHLYGTSHDPAHDWVARTKLLHNRYGFVQGISKFLPFGEDAFGNQFAYHEGEAVLFNIETGQAEKICDNLVNWPAALAADLDYFTGQSLVVAWNSSQRPLEPGQRLTPKLPFVGGGEYALENLYANDCMSIIDFNANLCEQIFDLPEGTEIRFDVK